MEVVEMLWLVSSHLLAPVVATVIVLAVILCYKHRQYDHIPGPKRSSFWLGHIPDIRKIPRTYGFFSNWILHMSIEHGETFAIWFHFRAFVFTVNQNSIKELLVTGGFEKDKRSYSLLSRVYGQRSFGRGLITEVDNSLWIKRRQVINPAFRKKCLKDMVVIFNERTDALVCNLSSYADGQTQVFLLDKFHLVTLDIIAKAAFHIDAQSLEKESSPLQRAIFQALTGISWQMKDPINRVNPFKHRKFKQACRDACQYVRQYCKQVLHDRIDAIERGDDVPTDVMTFCALAHRKQENECSEEELLDDFFTFFIAGQETTANLCGFAILSILQNPHIHQRLLEEIDKVVGDSKDITPEHLGQLEYLNCVIKETLRLFPPVGLTFRNLHKSHEIGSYKVPAGARVIVSTYVSSRHPHFHNNPETFNPERFSGKSEDKPGMYTFFPFSLGPRSCIGQTFAQYEAKVILAKTLKNFNFALDPDQSFDIQENMTLKPAGGVACTLSFRT